MHPTTAVPLYPDEDAVLLWGFCRTSQIDDVQRTCEAAGLPYGDVDVRRRPGWVPWLGEHPFLLDAESGEYPGAVGVERYSDEDPVIRRTRLTRQLRQRRPDWSERQVAGAVLAKLQREARGPGVTPEIQREREESIRRTRKFLAGVVSSGPITLLLDDGGTIPADFGGSAGRPDLRRPRLDEAVECRLEGITDMLLLEFPYWVPVHVAA